MQPSSENLVVAGVVLVGLIAAFLIHGWIAVSPTRITFIDEECQKAQEEYYSAYHRSVEVDDNVPADKNENGSRERNHADVCAQYRMAQAAERGLWLLFATLVFTGLAAIATWRTVNVLRQEFHATHRPHLMVHRFEFRPDMTQKVNAHFTIVNVGTTTADVTAIRALIFQGLETPELDEWPIPKRSLKSGERMSIHVRSDDISQLVASVDATRASRNFDSVGTKCVGYIIYSDANGTPRETGFDRRLDYDCKTWRPVPDSELEYSY